MNNLKQVLRLLGVLTFAFVFFGTVSGSAQAALTFSATDIASDGAFTLTFEGATANAFEVTLTSVDPGADATITLPAQTGTVLLSTAAQTAAGSIAGVANGFEFEGATDNGFETTLTVTDPTADRTITFPNETGTVVTTGSANVVTGMITDATILAADFAAGAVDTAAILDGTILTGDIAADTIVAGNIATGAVATAEILDATVASVDMSAGAKTHTVIIQIPDPGAAGVDITAGYVLWTPSVAVTITKIYTGAQTAWIAAVAGNDGSVVVTNAVVGAVATLAVVTNLAVGSNTDMGAITNGAMVAGTDVTIAVTTNGTADAPAQNIQIEYTTTN